jgi:hypothetical protein
LIYILSVFYSIEERHFKLRAVILGASRFLIGLGSNQMQGKRYITLYTPKYYLPILSKIYLITELGGFILGPIFTILFSFISIDKIICIFNCVGYYGVIVSIIMIILNQMLFIPPKDPRFLITAEEFGNNVNMSVSQDLNSLTDNDDDEQDKEFYRLQKEADERKKAGLEPTRSDDIDLEVNDKDLNKNIIATKADINKEEIKDNEKSKEEDEPIFNKILEDNNNIIKSGKTETFFQNVDIGRYSDVDLSKEQNETIKDIESKLFEYQEKSNFTNVDMIPRTLDDIILNEQKSFGYINRNYIKILFLLFFSA